MTINIIVPKRQQPSSTKARVKNQCPQISPGIRNVGKLAIYQQKLRER
ncbi:hypothetical protein ABLG01_004802 [Klebsiella pneumoniae]|jgi:hypothetical protein|nr:hypothetical protein [Klebsiella pneumoniae]MBL6013796.1 hypothetical protein [Klebsiella pneumoniae]MEC5522801.1 hypothetical protein [Klebsiella pneumoniae]HBS5675771.1 hypothetical protein [Klebsiella pneumoniae]HBS6923059.1 hypothetical protein [Klebsiella pneumoniae]HBU8027849.1 hypothetical protein [Klebsiella pneumoniae]